MKEFYVGFYVVAAMLVSLLLIIDAGKWAVIPVGKAVVQSELHLSWRTIKCTEYHAHIHL